MLDRRHGGRDREILAIAGAPTFRSRKPVCPPMAPALRTSRCAGMYEPGSTIKLITIAGAIEEGVVSPDTVIGAVTDQIELRRGRLQERHRRGFRLLLGLRTRTKPMTCRWRMSSANRPTWGRSRSPR